MALTAGLNATRRGQRFGRADFGYPVAPGEKVFRGGIACVNSSGQMVRPQTAGAVAFVGLTTATVDNSGGTTAGPTVVAERACYQLNVPSATVSDLNKAVYATDDGTLTLTAPTTGFTGQIGTLVGIENSQTWVLLEGA